MLTMFIGSTVQTTCGFGNGIVTWQLLKTFSAMSIAIVAGVLLGNRIFDRINVRLLRRLVYLVMAVSGLAMLF